MILPDDVHTTFFLQKESNGAGTDHAALHGIVYNVDTWSCSFFPLIYLAGDCLSVLPDWKPIHRC